MRLLQEADQRALLTSATMGSGSLSLPSEEETLPIEPSMQDVLVDAADSHWLSQMSTAERELEVSRRLWEVFDAVSCRLISGAAPERMSRAGRIAWRTLSSSEAVGIVRESPTGVDWMERLRSYREDRATRHRHWERNQTAQAPPRAGEAVRAVRAHPEGHHQTAVEMLRLARLSEWEKLRREVHRAREAGQEGSSISSRQAVVAEPRPTVTASDDPPPTSVGEGISSSPREGGEGVTSGNEDTGEELLSRSGTQEGDSGEGEELLSSRQETGSEGRENVGGAESATLQRSLPLRRARSSSGCSPSHRSRRRQMVLPAGSAVVAPVPPVSNNPSPSSLFAVRPSREQRAWPATAGLLSVTARVPRASAESSVPGAACRTSPRRRRRAFRGRGGLRTLIPTEEDESSTRVADDGGYRDIWRQLLLRLLSRGAVRLSSVRTADDPLSEPGSDDERYGLRVMALEGYRSRPPARGGVAQWVSVPGDAEELLRRWDEAVQPSAWHRQPRGIVSEWFPNP